MHVLWWIRPWCQDLPWTHYHSHHHLYQHRCSIKHIDIDYKSLSSLWLTLFHYHFPFPIIHNPDQLPYDNTLKIILQLLKTQSKVPNHLRKTLPYYRFHENLQLLFFAFLIILISSLNSFVNIMIHLQLDIKDKPRHVNCYLDTIIGLVCVVLSTDTYSIALYVSVQNIHENLLKVILSHY